jgi:serine phosphatase RsbU (regulator of sigma subunit)
MNLPFGSNVLEIKAESEDDLFQHQPAAYEFMVQAPFYLKWWFYAGIFLFLIAAVMMIVRYRVRTLKKQNILLEDTVQKRTLAITWQKEQIEAQKDEIEAQMDEIEAQRNQIEIQRDLVVSQNREITASISYAQRIQEAVLPSDAYMTEVMPEHFVLYKPRDMVSGDFYWIRRIKNYLVVVAADCTGHGVPGAFMSMLGISFLNEQVSKSRMDPPGEILNRLRKKVKDTLSQQGKVEEQKDGMDMALAMIDMEEKDLEFGGAYNPLYLIRKAAASDDHLMKYFALEVDGYRLYHLKGDCQPVGIYSMASDFSTKKIKLLEGDTIYLFSDGFADQVGGPRNKKFMSRNFKKTLLSIHHLSMKEQKKHLDDTLENWRGKNEQVDDILVMGMRM